MKDKRIWAFTFPPENDDEPVTVMYSDGEMEEVLKKELKEKIDLYPCACYLCWNCHEIVILHKAKIDWVESSHSDEMVQAYLCPSCNHAQYGIEVL